jgi:hypothetical protein
MGVRKPSGRAAVGRAKAGMQRGLFEKAHCVSGKVVSVDGSEGAERRSQGRFGVERRSGCAF